MTLLHPDTHELTRQRIPGFKQIQICCFTNQIILELLNIYDQYSFSVI